MFLTMPFVKLSDTTRQFIRTLVPQLVAHEDPRARAIAPDLKRFADDGRYPANLYHNVMMPAVNGAAAMHKECPQASALACLKEATMAVKSERWKLPTITNMAEYDRTKQRRDSAL